MAKSTETEVAVLKTQTDVLNRDLKEIKIELQTNNTKLEEIKELITQNYMTKGEFEAYVAKAAAEFETYKKSVSMQRWLIGIVTAIITAVLTYETIQFLSKGDSQ